MFCIQHIPIQRGRVHPKPQWIWSLEKLRFLILKYYWMCFYFVIIGPEPHHWLNLVYSIKGSHQTGNFVFYNYDCNNMVCLVIMVLFRDLIKSSIFITDYSNLYQKNKKIIQFINRKNNTDSFYPTLRSFS